MTVTIEGELIAPADTADLESRLMGANVLPLAEREALITNTLEQSAQMLNLVTRATDPAAFAKAGKSSAEVAAHYAKRLDVSKDLVLDAQVQQRRWERALGVAVREGQASGTIETPAEAKARATAVREAARLGHHLVDNQVMLKPRPLDYAAANDYSGNGAGIYHVTDNVSDGEFEQALVAARAEGKPSRANVVRKIREANGTAPAPEPTRTGDPKRAAKQVATFNRIINTLEANTMVIDELIRAGLDPAITDDEASRIVAGLEAFARATARVKKSLI